MLQRQLRGRFADVRPAASRQSGRSGREVKIYLSTTDVPGFEGGWAEVTTGDDGSFVIPAIAEGKLPVYPRLDLGLPVRPRPINDVEIPGNQTTKFAILLQKAAQPPKAVEPRSQ